MKFLDRFRKVEAKHNVQSIQPTAPVIQPKAQDRLYELIEREQLPGDVRDTLAGALTGDLPRQQLLFQAMIDTWPRLQKNLNEVSRAVASTPWEVKPYSMTGDEPTDSAIDKARMVENSIRGMMPRAAHDELGERGLTKSLVHGYYMGHQVCEVFWDRNEDGTVPRSAKVVPPRYYDYPDDGEDRLMYLPHGGYYSSGFEEFPEHHFVIALNRGHSGHASIAAPLRALTGYWLAATFGLKWLLQFAQLYGIPFRWATYDDESVRTKVCNMLENIGSAGWGAFPSGTDLQFVEAGKSAEALPQAMLLEMADRQCDTFILGQTLTTDVGDSGSRALGDVHQEVRAGVIQGVNDFVADIYTHQLIPSIIQLNYGNKDELPEYCATVEAPKDEIAMAQRDQTLISMGMAVSKEWLYDRHGVPMPEDGDDDIFSPQPRNGAAGEPQTGEFSAPHETDGGEGDSEEEVEARMVKAYDPDQPRGEKGTPQGGRWVKEDTAPQEGAVSQADSKRYSELEQKYNDGTITDEELGEAHDLVEKAAKAAGYDTEKVYHGTDAEFEVFDERELGTATDSESAEKAFFFSDDERTAKAYANWAAEEGPVKEALAEADRAEKIGDWDAYDKAVIKSEELAASAYERRQANARVIPAYLKGNFMEVDAGGKTPQELHGSGGDIDLGISSKLDEAKEGGYDGVIFRNLDDAVGLYDRPSDHYAVFNPNQIKSAEIFTGTPLEDRFNPEDDRITFSHGVQAYDPNQKRAAKGEANGGQWVKDDGAKSEGEGNKVEVFFGTPDNRFDKVDFPSNYMSDEDMFKIEENDTHGLFDRDAIFLTDSEDVAKTYQTALDVKDDNTEIIKENVEDEDLPDGTKVIAYPGKGKSKIILDGLELPKSISTPSGKLKKGVQLEVLMPNGVHAYSPRKDFSTPEKALESARELYNAPIRKNKFSGVRKLELDTSNFKTIDFKGGRYESPLEHNNKARAEGYDGVIFKNVLDVRQNPERAKPSNVYSVFNKEKITRDKKLESSAIKAAEQKKATIEKLSENVLESLTGVTREWLTPVRPYFEKLAAMAMSKNVTDEAFIEALEKSQTEMPELFDKLNVEALQTSMEDAIGTAMIAGSVERYEGQQVEAGSWVTLDDGRKVLLDNPQYVPDQGVVDRRKKRTEPKTKKKPLNDLEKKQKDSIDNLLKDLREKADRGEVYASESLADMKERIRKEGASISKKSQRLDKSIEYWKGQRSMVGQELDRPNSIYSIKPEPGEDGADYEERIKKRLAARKDKIAEYNEISDKIAEIENEKSYLGADLVKLPEADRGKALMVNKRASSIPSRRKGVELYESVIHKDLVESNSFKFAGSTTRAHHQRDWKTGHSIIRTHKSDSPTVVVHELVHGIEKDDVLKSSVEFLKKRRGNESLVRLRDLEPGKNYRYSEVAYKDKWKEKGGSHYTGKYYDNGILGGVSATETLTMGVQRLLKDPLEFMENDEEHFDFVVKTLQKRK